MNNEIVEELASLGIFSSKYISKSKYDKLLKENTDPSLIYLREKLDDGLADNIERFKQINTHKMSEDEIKLLLQIKQTQHIKTIKNVLLFYFGITLICLIIALFTVIIP